jgi:DNA ligase-4
MVRMLLKNYSPIHIPEILAMRQFHFLLPDLLSFQSSLEAAVKLLDEPTIRCMPYRVAKDAEGPLREIADSELKLKVGAGRGHELKPPAARCRIVLPAR